MSSNACAAGLWAKRCTKGVPELLQFGFVLGRLALGGSLGGGRVRRRVLFGSVGVSLWSCSVHDLPLG